MENTTLSANACCQRSPGVPTPRSCGFLPHPLARDQTELQAGSHIVLSPRGMGSGTGLSHLRSLDLGL